MHELDFEHLEWTVRPQACKVKKVAGEQFDVISMEVKLSKIKFPKISWEVGAFKYIYHIKPTDLFDRRSYLILRVGAT